MQCGPNDRNIIFFLYRLLVKGEPHFGPAETAFPLLQRQRSAVDEGAPL